MRSVSRQAVLLALWCAVLAPQVSALTEQQQRGLQLFTTGIAASGTEVRAEVGTSGVSLPGRALPCVNCHGRDGRGRPEGGVVPSDIRWSQLTKSYGVRSASGRQHPPYSDASFRRAVATGVDPAGTPLDSAMPRYRINPDDLDDLLAYLKVVDRIAAPGVSAGAIRLGTLLPDPLRAGLGQQIHQVLSAYFADVNAAGGVYGRQLQLLVEPFVEADEAKAATAAERLLDRSSLFALVSPVALQAPLVMAELAETRQIPLVAPFAQRSGAPGGLHRYSFYLLGDAAVRLRVITETAARAAHSKGGRALLLARAGALAETQLTALDLQQPGLTVVVYDTVAGLPRRLQAAGLENVTELIHFGDVQGLRGLVDATLSESTEPALYIAATGGMERVLAAARDYPGTLYVAYPMLASDLNPEAWRSFEQFRARHGLHDGPVQPQLHAYVAARLTVRALKGAGKKLTREGVLKELERLYHFQTGLMPAFTFGPNRRIGAYGAHVVEFDLDSARPKLPGRWIEPVSQH